MQAIADAIALKYAPGTLTTPSGQDAIRRVFSQAPNNIPEFPSIIVAPMHGKVVEGAQTWDLRASIEVQLYVGAMSGDLPRMDATRQAYLNTMLRAVVGSQSLGLSYVKSCMPVTWEFRTLEYAGAEYLGLIIDLELIIRETVALAP